MLQLGWSILGMYGGAYISIIGKYDSIKLLLIILTVIIYPVIIYVRRESIFIWLAILWGLLIWMFITDDILVFYILFEISLIPMVIIIWSTRKIEHIEQKIEAGNRIFLYTIMGSISILIGIIILWYRYGTSNYWILVDQMEEEIGQICWILFSIGFAIKIPIYPGHNWLPDAHTQAPTIGSMILAGIMLKIGAYGFIQYVLLLMNPYQNMENSVLIYWFSVQSLILCSIWTLRQIDIKKIIAYSSIIHMAITMLGIFSFDPASIKGSLISIFSHGIVSPALFLLCGYIYERYSSRIVYYYRGLSSIMPLTSIILVYFILANISMPVISLSFVGEFLIILGLIQSTGILLALAVVLSNLLLCIIFFWMMVKMIYGNISMNIIKVNDLNFSETLSLSPLVLISFIGGIYPSLIGTGIWVI